MARRLTVNIQQHPGFVGVPSVFEYTNADGSFQLTNCGQAAAATLLTHHGRIGLDQPAGAVMRRIEKEHPPDNLGGYLGTSRRRVVRICKAHGLNLIAVKGVHALRACLRRRQPVVVMLRMRSGLLFDRLGVPGGHWMVAYGFDEEQVFLSNYGLMSWHEFLPAWDAFVPRLIGMQLVGLVARPCAYPDALDSPLRYAVENTPFRRG